MEYQTPKQLKLTGVIVLVILIVVIGAQFFKSIPAGHVGVATLFGDVQEKTYSMGLHVPVNPLYRWTTFDARQKTYKVSAEVPSQDQLRTTMDVSVQYRVDGKKAASILRDTGTAQQAISVHLDPKIRSLLREQGKTIKRAEDFFKEETQQKLQDSLTKGLKDFLAPKGIIVAEVFVRDIRLPAFITKAIEAKKEREQEVEKQKAELERYETEQQQLVAKANAQRLAAEQTALMRRTLADAQAYEIRKINEAVAQNPAYIKLRALDALKAISKDPAAKIYFLNGDSPMPLPLMHMGSIDKQ